MVFQQTYGSLNLALSYKGFRRICYVPRCIQFSSLEPTNVCIGKQPHVLEKAIYLAQYWKKPFGSNSYVKGAPAMQSYYVEDGDYVKIG